MISTDSSARPQVIERSMSAAVWSISILKQYFIYRNFLSPASNHVHRKQELAETLARQWCRNSNIGILIVFIAARALHIDVAEIVRYDVGLAGLGDFPAGCCFMRVDTSCRDVDPQP